MASKRGGVGSRKACAFPPEDDYSAVKLLMYGDASPSVRSAGAAAIREAAAACAADKLLRSKGTPDSFERGKVLLYYKYVAVDDPQALRVWQRDLCAALDLRGRIHVGTEGINGTVGGTCEATRLYVEAMIKHSALGATVCWDRLQDVRRRKTVLSQHVCTRLHRDMPNELQPRRD